MAEKAIRLAAKLYETRDGLKLLLGDRYAADMAEVGTLLTAASKKIGRGIIETAGRLAKEAQKDGEDRIAVMYLAAAVELLEPSEAKRP
jgi:hypothetical protein